MKKVKQSVLDSVNNLEMRMEIARRLRVGEQSVAWQMRKNTTNGRMTKMDFLEVLSEISGVAISEILEDALHVEKEPQS
jgi:hypothetical protein